MSESKWWATLYDRDNRRIAIYHVAGWAKIDAMMLTWALRHSDLEYVQIGVKPLDESNVTIGINEPKTVNSTR